MIEIVAGCAAGSAILCARRLIDSRRLQSMARHPAPTFVFADLVGYTALTELRGDDAAARIAHEFWQAMSMLCRRHGARQVKAMGDGAMIWAPDAAQAVVLATTTIEELGTRDDLLPVRVGVHTGPAVMRGGDWYGGAVNLAARLATAAEPNQVLISGATLAATRTARNLPARSRRELKLAGVDRPTVAWALNVKSNLRRSRAPFDGRIVASLAS